MSESELDLLSRLWEEHLRTPFPPHIRGREFEYYEHLRKMAALAVRIGNVKAE